MSERTPSPEIVSRLPESCPRTATKTQLREQPVSHRCSAADAVGEFLTHVQRVGFGQNSPLWAAAHHNRVLVHRHECLWEQRAVSAPNECRPREENFAAASDVVDDCVKRGRRVPKRHKKHSRRKQLHCRKLQHTAPVCCRPLSEEDNRHAELERLTLQRGQICSQRLRLCGGVRQIASGGVAALFNKRCRNRLSIRSEQCCQPRTCESVERSQSWGKLSRWDQSVSRGVRDEKRSEGILRLMSGAVVVTSVRVLNVLSDLQKLLLDLLKLLKSRLKGL